MSNTERDDNIKAVVAEVLAEQNRLHPQDIDAVALKTIATILTSFGITEDDRLELKSDFQHLRRWRKATETAGGFALKAAVGVIISGILGAFWLGIKVVLGK